MDRTANNLPDALTVDPTHSQAVWVEKHLPPHIAPMAFVPRADQEPRILRAISIEWSSALIGELLAIQNAGRAIADVPKRNLPFTWLRSALQIRMPQLLRLDSRMGLAYLRPDSRQMPFALIGDTVTPVKTSQVVTRCLKNWIAHHLHDFVDGDVGGTAAIGRMRGLIEDKKAFLLGDIQSHSLPWWQNAGNGTARNPSRDSYATIVEELAQVLSGKELLPETGPVRRVVDKDPARNEIQLLTDPIIVEGGEFSFCFTLHCETIPSIGQPLIVFDVSKRRWINGELAGFVSAKSISGHVFVENLPDRVLTFSTSRVPDKNNPGKRIFETDLAFDLIKTTYELPLDLYNAQDIALKNYMHDEKRIKVRLTYAHGLTKERHALNAGVPERDWIEAFDRAAVYAASVGLIPFIDLKHVDKPKPPKADDIQPASSISDPDEESEDPYDGSNNDNVADPDLILEGLARERSLTTQDQMLDRYGVNLSSLKSKNFPKDGDAQKKERARTRRTGYFTDLCHANAKAAGLLGSKHKPVLYVIHQTQLDHFRFKHHLQLIEDTVRLLWGADIDIIYLPVPHGAHGPRSVLDINGGTTTKKVSNKDRFNVRMQAWDTTAKTVAASSSKAYCLIVANDWYTVDGKNMKDDVLNKPAARAALSAKGKARVQYLIPMRVAANGNPKVDDFFQRLQAALRDLLLAHNGTTKDYGSLARICFAENTEPKEVVGITIVRNRSGRVRKTDSSFVLAAFRQQAGSLHCQVRFAYDSRGQMQDTEWLDMQDGLSKLSSVTPAWLANNSDPRANQAQLKNSYQTFVKNVLDDCSKRHSQAVVMIDSTNTAALWPWITDQKMDANDVTIGDAQRLMQINWKGLRVVRIRQGLAPIIVQDKRIPYGPSESLDSTQELPTPVSGDGVYQVGSGSKKGVTPFWSIKSEVHQNPRGMSCYRAMPHLTRFQIKQKGSKKTLKLLTESMPFTGQWPTPNSVEFVVAIKQYCDVPANVAYFCHQMRDQVAHYKKATLLPSPLFFERVFRQYVSDFGIEGLDEAREEID